MGNLNIDRILEDTKEVLLILLGTMMILWLCFKKGIFTL